MPPGAVVFELAEDVAVLVVAFVQGGQPGFEVVADSRVVKDGAGGVGFGGGGLDGGR